MNALRWLIAIFLTAVPLRAEEAVLSADFSVHTGAIRPLHGINKGPLAPGGIFDVIQEHTELGFRSRACTTAAGLIRMWSITM